MRTRCVPLILALLGTLLTAVIGGQSRSRMCDIDAEKSCYKPCAKSCKGEYCKKACRVECCEWEASSVEVETDERHCDLRVEKNCVLSCRIEKKCHKEKGRWEERCRRGCREECCLWSWERDTADPTRGPTAIPTDALTPRPTSAPTPAPTPYLIDGVTLTNFPATKPTSGPTVAATLAGGTSMSMLYAKGGKPNKTEMSTTVAPKPTSYPTDKPTLGPTLKPTAKPTSSPTSEPTAKPTAKPTSKPTTKPTPSPTPEPTAKPTSNPTSWPTAAVIHTDSHQSMRVRIRQSLGRRTSLSQVV